MIRILSKAYASRLKRSFGILSTTADSQSSDRGRFVIEAAANCFYHSQFRAAFKSHLCLGESGFVFGMEIGQSGTFADRGNGFRHFRENVHDIFLMIRAAQG